MNEIDRRYHLRVVERGAETTRSQDPAAVLIDPAVVTFLPLGERGAEVVVEAVAIGIPGHRYRCSAIVLPRPVVGRVGHMILVEKIAIVEEDEWHVTPGKPIDMAVRLEWSCRNGEVTREVEAVRGGHELRQVAEDA